MVESTFKQLNELDVSKHIEKKMGLSYLSWSFAHQEMKKFDEEATVTIHSFPDVEALVALGQAGVEVTKEVMEQTSLNYKRDKAGAYVTVSVTIKGRTETESLPVMDFKNKAMTNPDAMSINKAHKRCFVKALALHGLGLYIYAGEDLPTKEDIPKEVEKVSDVQLKAIDAVFETIAGYVGKPREEIKTGLLNMDQFKEFPKELKQLSVDDYGRLLNGLNAIEQRYKEANAKKEMVKQTKLDGPEWGVTSKHE